MKQELSAIQSFRVNHPAAGWGDGHNGAAIISVLPVNGTLKLIRPDQAPASARHDFKVLFSNGAGWEHVSVSLPLRCPTWQEMCFFKDLFWDEDETVVQYHPPKAEYINCHPYCLHLWKPFAMQLPRPTPDLVG